MKKIVVFLLFLTSLSLLTTRFAAAEIVELQTEEKSFGDWKVYCETDVMMDISHCKIATKFYDSGSVVTIEPTTKFFNQLFIVIPKIRPSTFVKLRVDTHNLILSDNVRNENFGLIKLSDADKNNLYSQMKNGDFLFFRFKVRDSDKEITVKLDLKDFRNALEFYNSKVKPPKINK